jgi:mannose-6-phosphate isomerase-like protein (cupin superfamily)
MAMASSAAALDLSSSYLRLRPDVSIEPLAVDGTFWERLGSGQLGDFRNEYLVITHECAQDWSFWEMHPKGDEVVCLLSGSLDFVLEMGREERRVSLEKAGQFVLVPKGIWHTAKVAEPSRLLFITAGEGTQHRPLAGT